MGFNICSNVFLSVLLDLLYFILVTKLDYW